MTYRTHREFAVCFVILANFLVYKLHLSQTGYYVNLIVMLVCGKQGALFPDVDHIWQNVKEKTTINFVINKIIHLTGGRHRSWQTHSWDIWLISLIVALQLNARLDESNRTVFILIVLGFWSGWFSHLFADMLTLDGVRLFAFTKKSKVAFVPKRANMLKNLLISVTLILLSGSAYMLPIPESKTVATILLVAGLTVLGVALKLKNMKFNTGGIWEETVYRVTIVFNAVFMALALAYPLLEKVGI